MIVAGNSAADTFRLLAPDFLTPGLVRKLALGRAKNLKFENSYGALLGWLLCINAS
jgi:hypothetical protein